MFTATVFSGMDAPAAVLQIPLEITAHFSFQSGGMLVSDQSGRQRLLLTNAISRRVGIFEARSNDGSTWSTPQRVFDAQGAPTAAAPSLAVDAQGGLHAIWCDTRTGGWITYAADAPAGGDFGVPNRVSEVEGLETVGGGSLQLETAITVQNGVIFVAWLDPRGAVYFSTMNVP
jgi:hypothetical protein